MNFDSLMWVFFSGSELLTIMFSRKNDFRSFMNCLRRHIIFSDNRKINFELVKDFFWKHAVSSLLILFLQKLFLNTERIKLCKFVVSLPTLNKNNFEKFLMLDFFIFIIFFILGSKNRINGNVYGLTEFNKFGFEVHESQAKSL